MINLLFNETWNDMETLHEEDETEANEAALKVVNPIYISKIIDDVYGSQSYVLTSEKDQNSQEANPIIAAAMEATKKFKMPARQWPYVLQLVCNAAETEKFIITNIKRILDLTNYKTDGDLNPEFGGAHDNDSAKNKEDHDKVYFPDEDNGTDLILRDYFPKDTPRKDTNLYVEVKTTANSNQSAGKWRITSFHNADIVFITALSTEDRQAVPKLFVRYGENLENGNYKSYSEPIELTGIFNSNTDLRLVRVITNQISLVPWTAE